MNPQGGAGQALAAKAAGVPSGAQVLSAPLAGEGKAEGPFAQVLAAVDAQGKVGEPLKAETELRAAELFALIEGGTNPGADGEVIPGLLPEVVGSPEDGALPTAAALEDGAGTFGAGGGQVPPEPALLIMGSSQVSDAVAQVAQPLLAGAPGGIAPAGLSADSLPLQAANASATVPSSAAPASGSPAALGQQVAGAPVVPGHGQPGPASRLSSGSGPLAVQAAIVPSVPTPAEGGAPAVANAGIPRWQADLQPELRATSAAVLTKHSAAGAASTHDPLGGPAVKPAVSGPSVPVEGAPLGAGAIADPTGLGADVSTEGAADEDLNQQVLTQVKAAVASKDSQTVSITNGPASGEQAQLVATATGRSAKPASSGNTSPNDSVVTNQSAALSLDAEGDGLETPALQAAADVKPTASQASTAASSQASAQASVANSAPVLPQTGTQLGVQADALAGNRADLASDPGYSLDGPDPGELQTVARGVPASSSGQPGQDATKSGQPVLQGTQGQQVTVTATGAATAVVLAEAAGSLGDPNGSTSLGSDLRIGNMMLDPVAMSRSEPMTTPGQVHSGHLATQVAGEIARNLQNGQTRFQMRFDPPELGRVEVKMRVSADGSVQAHLIVERPETLDMFMRDQRGLERALEAAGLQADSNNLKFSLKDQSGQGFASGDGSHGDGQQRGSNEESGADQDIADADVQMLRFNYHGRPDGLDIQV